jgi:hypothetical protein
MFNWALHHEDMSENGGCLTQVRFELAEGSPPPRPVYPREKVPGIQETGWGPKACLDAVATTRISTSIGNWTMVVQPVA